MPSLTCTLLVDTIRIKLEIINWVSTHGRTIMNIGIIGAGNIGSGLGKIWAKKGHKIIFSFSRNPEKLGSLSSAVENAAAGSPAEAVRQSDVILFSVRWTNVREALEAAGPLQGKIVIDCTNPLNPDLSGLEVGHTSSAAEEIATIAAGAKVVKAFNTVFADVYHSESRLFGSRMPTMFYCGDDGDAKNTVAKLIREAGFEPVDAGSLRSARYLEPLAMLMIQLGYGQGMGTNITLNLIRR
jgi:8-hydroxy-5-deazaflavin:NADPH oxidoreductase